VCGKEHTVHCSCFLQFLKVSKNNRYNVSSNCMVERITEMRSSCLASASCWVLRQGCAAAAWQVLHTGSHHRDAQQLLGKCDVLPVSESIVGLRLCAWVQCDEGCPRLLQGTRGCWEPTRSTVGSCFPHDKGCPRLLNAPGTVGNLLDLRWEAVHT
jgi:hypothetical protein